MRTPSIRLAGIVAAALLTWTSGSAQEVTTGTITGKVTDPTGRGIPGAVVIATSASGTRTADTDAGGSYILPFLRPGSYSLRVEAPGGFTTVIKNDVPVGLSERLQLNFKLEPGKTETVTVTGEAPLVDTKSTGASTNIRYDEFANSVPLGRSFTDTYAVAPGVVSGLGTGQGNYSIGGASGLENSYLIDGVNVTNTGYGGIGAYNIVYGSLGTGVTSEFLDEVQIKTAGFEAEYGRALGGIINTIVKSGTNDFKGSVAWYATPGGARSDYRLVDLQSGTSNLIHEDVQDFAFSVGGPIRKDKLFYFIAFNPVITTQRNQANSIVNPGFAAAAPGTNPRFSDPITGFDVTDVQAFPSSARELERTRTADNYAVKLSWRANPSHQVDLTFFGDPATGDRGFQRDIAPLFTDFASGGGQSEIEYGSNNGTLKWNGVISPKFFVEAQIGRHVGKFREDSVKDETRYLDLRNNLEFRRGATSYSLDGTSANTAPFTVPLTPVADYRGGVGFISNQDDKSTQYLVKLTNIAGNHEFKWGVEYDDIGYLDTGTYTGSSFNVQLPVSDDTGAPVDALTCDGGTGTCSPGADGIQDVVFVPTRGGAQVSVRNGTGNPTVAFDSANRFRVTRARMGPALPPTSAREYNAFLQDTWTVVPRVTLKLGLRATQETVGGSGRFSLPFATRVVDVGGVPTRIYQPGTSNYDPNRYSFTGNLAPRLGVVWDVQGDGKSKAYLNWGRYFERVPNDLAVRAFSNEVGVSLQEFNDQALTSARVLAGGLAPGSCVDGSGVASTCDPLGATFTQGVEPTTVVGGAKLPYEDELSGGYAFELTPTSSLEARLIYRTQGRALEDTQVNAIEQIQNFYYGVSYGYPYDPFGGVNGVDQGKGVGRSAAFPATVFGPYVLANPGTSKVPQGGLFPFPKPERTYEALELIYNRRFSNNWSVLANYRLSKLEGNYEGLFRNDNGQSDPNITSLYDFPSSPLLQSQFASGPLPSDARHVLHVYPSYVFPIKLRVGANLTWQTGVPRTSMLAHPIYQNAGEIPGKDPVYGYWADPGTGPIIRTTSSLPSALTDPDALSNIFLYSYTPVRRGNLGRTPSVASLDLHADYPVTLAKSQLRIMFDVFNATDSQKPMTYEDTVELTAGVTDPDFLKAIQYQVPRSFRLAARWEF